MNSFLELPTRAVKPRKTGITSLLDNGIPTQYFKDCIESNADLIDYVKFGWGSSLVTHQIAEKIALCKNANIDFYFGGTLFEKAYVQGKLEEYSDFCESYDCEIVEVSDGTIELSEADKAKSIELLAKKFKVLSEVGYKDSVKSLNMHPARWVAAIERDLNSGAMQVITESRESGTSGVCRQDGELRFGLILEILERISADKLIFEAPNKSLQTFFIKHVGANVNLGNISFGDVIALETLRLGLRSDTLLHFEGEEN